MKTTKWAKNKNNKNKTKCMDKTKAKTTTTTKIYKITQIIINKKMLQKDMDNESYINNKRNSNNNIDNKNKI